MKATSTKWATARLNLLAGLLALVVARPVGALPVCGGDCDGDGRVRVNELVKVVYAILHDQPASACVAADMNENGELAVNEVIVGSNNSLIGCPSARVDAAVAKLIGDDTPGMAIMVIDHGQILHERAYGLADVAGGVAVTTDTRFFTGSLMKPFTALAVAMLSERGELDLDDPVSIYLPELARFGDEMTIRSLLIHTSGLPDYFVDDTEIYARWAGLDAAVVAQALALLWPAPNPDPSLYTELLQGSNTLTSLGLAAVLEEYGALRFAPGDAASYSNTGYDLLGGVVERASGQPFGDFVRDNILVPVGMEQSFLLPGTDQLGRSDVAKGYARVGETFEPYEIPPQEAIGSGDLFTTVGDLYLFDQALDGETLVSQETLRAIFTPQKLNDGSDATDPLGKIGIGWLLTDIAGERAAFHPGLYVGYVASMTRFLDRKLTIIILTNREDQTFEALALVPILTQIYLHPAGR